jgi:adenine phosphoribosyltransferase
MNYDDYIDKIPNFPKEGILFYDIAPLLYNQLAFKSIIEEIAKNIEACKPDLIVAIESRGFLVASALSIVMDKGFLMVRKKGKTPGKTISYEYQLEYGTDLLEIRENINIKDKKIVIVDDLLATGGTVQAAINLVKKTGASVCCLAFLIELIELGGRKKLEDQFKDFNIFSVLKY